MKRRLGSRAKKLIKSKKGGSVRLRHTSSGGSSTDLYHPRKSKLPGLSRGLRSRKRTVSAKDESKSIEQTKPNDDNDENYDEFDLLAEMKDRSIRRIRTTSESGPRYLRSLSENAPQTPLGGTIFKAAPSIAQPSKDLCR